MIRSEFPRVKRLRADGLAIDPDQWQSFRRDTRSRYDICQTRHTRNSRPDDKPEPGCGRRRQNPSTLRKVLYLLTRLRRLTLG
jgi:hypothetical protein